MDRFQRYLIGLLGGYTEIESIPLVKDLRERNNALTKQYIEVLDRSRDLQTLINKHFGEIEKPELEPAQVFKPIPTTSKPWAKLRRDLEAADLKKSRREHGIPE